MTEAQRDKVKAEDRLRKRKNVEERKRKEDGKLKQINMENGEKKEGQI